MESVVTLIQEVGFPIAAALGLGWFIYKLIMRIVDGMETKLDTVDEKVEGQIAAITPTPKDDHWFSYLYKVIDWCALNVLKAKDKG